MTKATRPVRRETLSSVRAARALRPLVIEILPTYMRIKPKGMRTYYTVTYDQLYTLGAKNAAETARREKMEKRKARAKGGFTQ
jgi:hypothetical protein